MQAITVAGAAPLASECAIGIDLAALAPEADVTDALVRRAPRAARGTTYAVARARLPSEPNVARAAELTVPAVVARRARTCAVEALAMARAANGTVDTGAPCAIVAAVAGAAAARATWMHRVVGSGVATTPHRSQCNRCKGTLSYMPCIGALAHCGAWCIGATAKHLSRRPEGRSSWRGRRRESRADRTRCPSSRDRTGKNHSAPEKCGRIRRGLSTRGALSWGSRRQG